MSLGRVEQTMQAKRHAWLFSCVLPEDHPSTVSTLPTPWTAQLALWHHSAAGIQIPRLGCTLALTLSQVTNNLPAAEPSLLSDLQTLQSPLCCSLEHLKDD